MYVQIHFYILSHKILIWKESWWICWVHVPVHIWGQNLILSIGMHIIVTMSIWKHWLQYDQTPGLQKELILTLEREVTPSHNLPFVIPYVIIDQLPARFVCSIEAQIPRDEDKARDWSFLDHVSMDTINMAVALKNYMNVALAQSQPELYNRKHNKHEQYKIP